MDSNWLKISPTLFFILEHRSPIITPTDVIDNPLKAALDDIQNDTTKPATTEITPSEIKEKNNKLIQKETMATGSVSFILFHSFINST